MQKVKFYDAGGHSAGREMTDEPGQVIAVSGDRFREIEGDGRNVLRSQYGNPASTKAVKREEDGQPELMQQAA